MSSAESSSDDQDLALPVDDEFQLTSPSDADHDDDSDEVPNTTDLPPPSSSDWNQLVDRTWCELILQYNASLRSVPAYTYDDVFDELVRLLNDPPDGCQERASEYLKSYPALQCVRLLFHSMRFHYHALCTRADRPEMHSLYSNAIMELGAAVNILPSVIISCELRANFPGIEDIKSHIKEMHRRLSLHAFPSEPNT
ncbi:MAG TPA: hypothetical protein VJB82_03305 [Candidatus Peribacterales bacterium]|nr:hypothetical protein [Candidatus Peribacterales bacterium]